MEADLEALDERIRQLIRLMERLRTENVQLRQQLAGAQSDNRHLHDKLELARQRLEALLARLPGEPR
jgi:cell division protein ZapB